MMNPEESLQMSQLVRKAMSVTPGEFRPCAMFDDRLDCIRVLARDCSFTEIRVDSGLTIIEDNYPASSARKYVGFTVKGARHFCQSQGLSLSMPIRVVEILDALVKASPDPVVRMIIDRVAKPLVEEERIDAVSLELAPA